MGKIKKVPFDKNFDTVSIYRSKSEKIWKKYNAEDKKFSKLMRQNIRFLKKNDEIGE